MATSAQEVEAPVTEVEPVVVDDANLYVVEDVVVNGVLFIILALLTLLGAAIVAVWRSAPAWMGNSLTPLVDGVLKLASDYATKTPGKLDDEFINAIRAIITKEMLAYTEQLKVAPSVAYLDKKIYGDSSNTSGRDNDLGEPVLADAVPSGG
jgi:hypothetical protein